MFKFILTYGYKLFDILLNKYYPSSKNKILLSMIKDYSDGHINITLNDYIDSNGRKSLKEMYIILNDFYNSKLSFFIAEGDINKISELRYLQIVIINIKEILNSNN